MKVESQKNWMTCGSWLIISSCYYLHLREKIKAGSYYPV
jgi:hypothetical protein